MKLRSWLTGAITLAAAAALCGSLAMAAHAAVGNGNQGANAGGVPRIALTTKAPYEPEGNLHSYPQPPRGFQPVFTENVQRHGSPCTRCGRSPRTWRTKATGRWTAT